MTKIIAILIISALITTIPISIANINYNSNKYPQISSTNLTYYKDILLFLKVEPNVIEISVNGHIGPVWLPIEPIILHVGPDKIHKIRINGETPDLEPPFTFYLRGFFGLGPTYLSIIHPKDGNFTFFGICRELIIIPDGISQVGTNSIYEQPLFNVTDIEDFGQTAWGVSSADFNNDSYMDFAVSWASGPFEYSKISIFYNNGNGGFTRDDVYTFDYAHISDLDSGDYDNDGDIDLLYTYSEYMFVNGLTMKINGTGRILFNDGNNNFAAETLAFWHGLEDPTYYQNRINPHITSADYDMDGDIDFLVGDNSGKVEFYINDGTGNFSTNGIIYDFGYLSWGLTSEDFDKDGDIDFLVAAAVEPQNTNGYIYLISNQIIESNGSYCFEKNQGEIIIYINAIVPTACLQALDYDNDGDMDFISGIIDGIYYCDNKQDFFGVFYLGNLPGSYEGYVDAIMEGGMTSADFNNDDKSDIVLGGVQGVVRLGINNYGELPPFKPIIDPPIPPLYTGVEYELSFMTIDFNEDDVYYLVDWGDGNISDWIGPFPSGEWYSLDHVWTEEHAHIIKVKAKDIHGAESVWQEIIIIFNKKINHISNNDKEIHNFGKPSYIINNEYSIITDQYFTNNVYVNYPYKIKNKEILSNLK